MMRTSGGDRGHTGREPSMCRASEALVMPTIHTRVKTMFSRNVEHLHLYPRPISEGCSGLEHERVQGPIHGCQRPNDQAQTAENP